MLIMAWRAASEGPMGFSLASMWMPLLGSANVGRAACARCDSVRMGMVASADAPAAKRKNERRENALQTAGSRADGICVNSSVGWGLERVRMNGYQCLRTGRKGVLPYLKVSLKCRENKGKSRDEGPGIRERGTSFELAKDKRWKAKLKATSYELRPEPVANSFSNSPAGTARLNR